MAVLTTESAVAPRAVAQFSGGAPRLQSEAMAAGFSYGGVLGAPTISFGTVSDLRGLRGEQDITRLQLETLEGDAGGPVLDEAGGVLGMVLPKFAVSLAEDRLSRRHLTAAAQLARIYSPTEAVESVLLADYQVGRSQLDGLWSYVGHKGQKKATKKPTKKGPSGARL